MHGAPAEHERGRTVFSREAKRLDLAIVGQILILLGLLAPLLAFLSERVRLGSLTDFVLMMIDALRFVFFAGIACWIVGLFSSGTRAPPPFDAGISLRKIRTIAALAGAAFGIAHFLGLLDTVSSLPSAQKIEAEIERNIETLSCPSLPETNAVATFVIIAAGETMRADLRPDPPMPDPASAAPFQACSKGPMSAWRFNELPRGSYVYARLPLLVRNGGARLDKSPGQTSSMSFVQAEWVTRGLVPGVSMSRIEDTLSNYVDDVLRCMLLHGVAFGDDNKPLHVNVKLAPNGTLSRITVGHILQRGGGDWRDNTYVQLCVEELLRRIPFPAHEETGNVDVMTLVEFRETVLKGAGPR